MHRVALELRSGRQGRWIKAAALNERHNGPIHRSRLLQQNRHKREVQRYPLFGRYQGKPNVARTSRFVDSEVIRGMPLQEVAGDGREAWRAVSGALRGCCEQHFVPAHNPRALMSYCVRNLYVTIRATMLAKISSAERDFRIIGLVEWRAADGAG